MGKNDFCCAHDCSNNRKRNPQLKFYRIPKDQARRKAWLLRIRRENFSPTENTRLCSAHFVDGVKSDNPKSTSFLPSIFSYNRSVPTPRTSKNSSRSHTEENIPPAKRRRVVKVRRRVAIDALFSLSTRMNEVDISLMSGMDEKIFPLISGNRGS